MQEVRKDSKDYLIEIEKTTNTLTENHNECLEEFENLDK